MKTTLENIEGAVSWYGEVKSDFSDIDTLMRVQRALATWLFEYAGEVGMLYKGRNRSEFQRKAAFARARQEGIAKGENVSKAEAAAAVAIEELMKAESEADAEFKAAALLLEHGRDVLGAMVQHISHLKSEKRMEANGTGSQR